MLFNLKGRELAVSERACTLLTPQPGWMELDPNEIWLAVIQIIREISQNLTAEIEIQGIGLSTQGGSLIPVDLAGTPTYNLVTWLDRRSESLVANWQENGRAQKIRQISGWEPQPGLPLPSICALRQTQPEVFSATHKFLSVNDFIAHRLTGEYTTNPSMAGEMLLTNIQTGAWDQELCDLGGIQIDQLAPILPSDAIVGEIRPEICQQTGLRLGIPLINGGQDHSCEALALGMTDPGCFLLACGTAWVINGVNASPNVAAIPPEMALNKHVLPDRYIASQFLGGLGAGMEWWLDQFWQNPLPDRPISRSERYASFNETLAQTEPGCKGLYFHPVSGTPRTEFTPGGFSGLRLDHTRAEMGRAVLESSAFELRWAIENIRAFGLPVNGLWMVGGAARSPIWPQILADVTEIPISLTQYTHGPSLGAALLAAKGLGLLESFPRWVTPQTIQPNPDNVAVYDEIYSIYIAGG